MGHFHEPQPHFPFLQLPPSYFRGPISGLQPFRREASVTSTPPEETHRSFGLPGSSPFPKQLCPVNQMPKKPRPMRPKTTYGMFVFRNKPEGLGGLNTWTEQELVESRRIIAFQKMRIREAVHLECSPISPEEYKESMITISCIYWMPSECVGKKPEFMGRCVFTSVDVITLLQKIVEQDFNIQEKNRIRRNLEGCHPITVKKEGDTLQFFNQLMSYAQPKTRNIEKDIKVFKWESLTKAMRTIFTRYTLRRSSRSSTSKTLALSIPPSLAPVDAKNSASKSSGVSPRSLDKSEQRDISDLLEVGIEFGHCLGSGLAQEAFDEYSNGIPGDFSLFQ